MLGFCSFALKKKKYFQHFWYLKLKFCLHVAPEEPCHPGFKGTCIMDGSGQTLLMLYSRNLLIE